MPNNFRRSCARLNLSWGSGSGLPPPSDPLWRPTALTMLTTRSAENNQGNGKKNGNKSGQNDPAWLSCTRLPVAHLAAVHLVSLWFVLVNCETSEGRAVLAISGIIWAATLCRTHRCMHWEKSSGSPHPQLNVWAIQRRFEFSGVWRSNEWVS